MPRGQLVPRLVVGQRPGDAAGQPQPAQLVLLGERLVTERAQRDLQRRRRRDVALVGEEGEPVEQQIAGARRGLPVGGQNGRRDLARIASAHQPVGGKGRRERFEVGLARERRVQRLEPPGRLEQQRRSIATPRHREGDLRVQQLGTRLVELVQRPRLRDRQQPQRRVGRAGLVLAFCGEQRTLRPASRIGRELDGALVKRRLRRQATACPRSSRRALQLGGDVLVEPGCRVRKVPGAAIRIDIGIGGLGERAVDALALLRRCRGLDRRTDERMTEAHLRAEVDQSGVGRRRGRVRPDPERRGRPPHQHRIAHRLGRRDEQQQSCRRGQRRQPLGEALLDPPRQRHAVGQPEPARELGEGSACRGSSSSASGLPRVSATIRSRTRSSSGPATTVASSSRASRSSSPPTASSGNPSKCRSPLGSRTARTSPTDSAPKRRATNASACAEAASSHCASSTMQTSGRSSATSDSRLKTARPTRNRSGALAVAQTERGAERIALRTGKALEAIQERRTQLLQPRVRELHLRLDPGRPGDAAPGRVRHQILQQRALADAGLPAQHQRPARTSAHARHQLIQRRALATPAKQPPRRNNSHCHLRSVGDWRASVPP